MFRLAFAFALLAIAIPARAQDCAADDFSPLCSDLRAQAGFEAADEALNAVYGRLLAQLSRPAGETLDYPTLKAKLVEAQRKWIEFREADCDAWYVFNEAGTGRNVDRMQCLSERTNDRTRQLEQWQANVP